MLYLVSQKYGYNSSSGKRNIRISIKVVLVIGIHHLLTLDLTLKAFSGSTFIFQIETAILRPDSEREEIFCPDTVK